MTRRSQGYTAILIYYSYSLVSRTTNSTSSRKPQLFEDNKTLTNDQTQSEENIQSPLKTPIDQIHQILIGVFFY